MSPVMRKPVYAISEQQRRRTVCASAQSDQHLCCSLPRSYDTATFYIQNFKPLHRVCGCAGPFESTLVTNLENNFPRDKAQITCIMERQQIHAYICSTYEPDCKFSSSLNSWIYPSHQNLYTDLNNESSRLCHENSQCAASLSFYPILLHPLLRAESIGIAESTTLPSNYCQLFDWYFSSACVAKIKTGRGVGGYFTAIMHQICEFQLLKNYYCQFHFWLVTVNLQNFTLSVCKYIDTTV